MSSLVNRITKEFMNKPNVPRMKDRVFFSLTDSQSRHFPLFWNWSYI